jgi:hypothetical protein
VQYRRDRPLPSGSRAAHWLHRRMFLLAIPRGVILSSRADQGVAAFLQVGLGLDLVAVARSSAIRSMCRLLEMRP